MHIDLTDALAAKFGKNMADIFTPSTAIFLLKATILLKQKSEFDSMLNNFITLSKSPWMDKNTENQLNNRLYEMNRVFTDQLRNLHFDVRKVIESPEQKKKYAFQTGKDQDYLNEHLYHPIYCAAKQTQDVKEDFANYLAEKKEAFSTPKPNHANFILQKNALKKSMTKLEKEMGINQSRFIYASSGVSR